MSFTYDKNGNTLTKVVSGNTTQYAWDFENRLSSVTLPGTGGTVAFKYDPFGRRIQKTFTQGTTTATTNYLYDGQNSVEEVDQNGSVLARYTQGTGVDEPLSELRSGASSYYEQDGLGSITSLSSSMGSIANTYVYDTFGNLSTSTGNLGNPFQYTGRDYDPETGLRYYRARYYDPTTGRFISEDPIGFGGLDFNFYRYVGNNPVVLIDPLGHGAKGAAIGAGIGGAIGGVGGGVVGGTGSAATGAAGCTLVAPVVGTVGCGVAGGAAGATAGATVGAAWGATVGAVIGDTVEDVIDWFKRPKTACNQKEKEKK